MKKEINYTFHNVAACNMCKADSSQFKVLGKRLNQSQGRSPKKKTGISTTIMKCKNCGLIFSNPLPIPNDIQDHYGTPPESYWTEDYFNVSEDYFSKEIQQLKKLKGELNGISTLDIGAGIGKCMIALSKQGCKSYGIEPSIPFYERALSKMNISKDSLQNKPIEDAEFEHSSFDFITFGAVLEHLYDPSASIEKAMNWLKPNGILHMEIPSSDWLIHKMINAYYKVTGSEYVGNLSPMHPPYHLYEFALKSFKFNGKINNYSIAHSEYFVCQTYMPSAINWIIKPYMKRTDKGMQLSVWLKKNA